MHKSYKYIRCLYCLYGHEKSVVDYFEQRSACKALFPMKKKPYWLKPGWGEELKPLLSGYVFLYSNKAIPGDVLAGVPNVLNVLAYPDDAEGYLRGRDRDFAEWLLKEDGLVGFLSAVWQDGRVEITDDFLRRFQARVIRVDKRKRLAELEMRIVADAQRLWLGWDTGEADSIEDGSASMKIAN